MTRKIDFSGFLIFDGGMGTMLQAHAIKIGELPESYNFLHPEIVEKIHDEYVKAGADIITANTFGANRYKLKGFEYGVEEIIENGVEIARRAAKDRLVALDIGPIGQLMKPYGSLSFEEAYNTFAQQVRAGAGAGADLILIETMSDVYEAKAAILAAKENSSLPVFCTMTFQQDGRSLTGTDPLTMVNIIQGLGVQALGINCSLGPKEIMPLVEQVLKYSKVPVITQPNAGLPKVVDGNTVFDISPYEFAEYAGIMAEMGVYVLGGCCGTNPDHIKALRNKLADLKPIKRKVETITAVSSSSNTVIFGEGIKIIGERINPTGKNKLKHALINGDTEYILLEAVKQRDKGAHILDVNTGLPEIDEKALMVNIIKEIQSIVALPLQIDSARSDVIEAAVRIYNGKPLINSANGKKSVMEQIFPIAKKYGACVICLTLDETGIPAKAEERFEIAKKMVEKAQEYGISKEDLIIDCLALTASSQQDQVKETVKALALIKERLGVKTTLGISNVSFGLPNRGLLNRTFLAAALGAGLDAPIMDPLNDDMMATVDAFNVLWNHDKKAAYYISHTGKKENLILKLEHSDKDLQNIIINGLKEEASSKTNTLLQEIGPMDIVEKYLIPSLNIVGQKYERRDIFLPQLIQSAETVKKAFQVIKDHMMNNKEENVDMCRGKIVLATVRGDIHDIGKNIVKILLENYGFEVIDLGKDVPEEDIVRVVRENRVSLVGLSALMTTTVKSMENTINALRQEGLDCKVMVGGAVLNDSYAKMIKADYYGKDALASINIAKEVFRDAGIKAKIN
jgi:5-methyltetrahydrofolate--homocysteine methyltransferase